ncbi:MAG TPA: DUF1501 domain-containing protein [Pirellulaceae bacterium]|nr:DUF1501 domain-containing protein [Pirellulaceae bacterium]
MPNPQSAFRVPQWSRRQLFSWSAFGLGATALAGMLSRDGVVRADGIPGEAQDPPPHLPAKAQRVIHICCCGGYSQIDTFDYKPELARRHGQPLGGDEKPDVFFGQVGLLRANDFAFQQRGESGLWVSDLFPHLAEVADELTVIRSMFAESSSHTPATMHENSGFRLNGFPALGTWLSYGLGNETDELPAYVVLPDPRGLPAGGTNNWTSGFLPAQHQGVMFNTTRGAGVSPARDSQVIRDLNPARPIAANIESASRELHRTLNELHQAEVGESSELTARMKAYELAAKMQLAVPRVTDLSGETAATLALYGLDQEKTAPFGQNCLLARRLIEQGVRFVQLFSGGAFGSPRINWDGHEDVKALHTQEAGLIDQPVAGLLKDLRQRGLLEDTLVLFTTEFGRTPFTQSAADQVGAGRDHNQYGFSVWLAGAGLKHGLAYGATDDVGWKAIENRVAWHDFHATVLHLLGIDHERLTFYHNGIQRRLTNVHGNVIRGILA